MNELSRHAARWLRPLLVAGVAALPALIPLPVHAQATIVIENDDGPDEGFNDPTPVAPVGGNSGTTLGQQRMAVFRRAAEMWATSLTSPIPIRVRAAFDLLPCNENVAALGGAGARWIVREFAGGVPGTWYNVALASKLSGVDQAPGPTEPDPFDIRARFNSELGKPGCLTGSAFYLGLDNNPPLGQFDLLVVVMHELAHGLGFQTSTNPGTGAQAGGFPSIYDRFLRGTARNELWPAMTNMSRRNTAMSTRGVVWDGPNVRAAAPQVLERGAAVASISSTVFPAVNNSYTVGYATFGPRLTAVPVVGQLMPVITPTSGAGAACQPLTGADALAVRNRVALIQRGQCDFAVKAKHAQDAGAMAVIIYNEGAGPPPIMDAEDPDFAAIVRIPTVSITRSDGLTLMNYLRFRSRTTSGIFASLTVDANRIFAGDALNRPYMYTPSSFQQGSTISHWDVTLFPNQLMEPSITRGLSPAVRPPRDLTLPLLLDLGW